MHLIYRCGTIGFVAPEVLNQKSDQLNYNEKCDLFSIGVIFHQMLKLKLNS